MLYVRGFKWLITVLVDKFQGGIPVEEFTTLIILQLFGFGIIMVMIWILGGYIWRSFDATRNRLVYIIEEQKRQ